MNTMAAKSHLELDTQKILSFFNNNPNLLNKAVALYKEHIFTTYDSLHEAINTQDATNIKFHAHKAKGMSARFCCEPLTQALQHIESHAQASSADLLSRYQEARNLTSEVLEFLAVHTAA